MAEKAFATDHPIEMIRGLKMPSRSSALRSLAQRAAWLSNRMELDARLSVREAEYSIFMHELKAVAIAVAAIERVAELERLIADANPPHPPITGRGYTPGCPCSDCREREAEAKGDLVGFAERLDDALAETREKVGRKLAEARKA